ncbi:hypothetical protein C0J52_00377 [Blattella germanica]|nr:hypothetical protein C0J52_00377 [Blattella germanica]
MLVYNGKVSLYSFLGSLIISALLLIPRTAESCVQEYVWWILPSYYILINAFLLVFFRGYVYQVAVRAAFLGFIFAVGLFVATLAPSSWHVFGWYMCFMSFFHYSEYLAIALTNPRALSLDSFILNHSVEYGVAATARFQECDQENIRNWLECDVDDPGHQVLTDDEIIASVIDDQDLCDEEEEPSDEDYAEKGPSSEEGFHCLETAMKWVEQQEECGLKEVWFLSYVGVALCIGGEVLRKLAMFTARTNFNHVIQSIREDDHQLVTHGVYNWCRHPSYVGWFYWSIGTQLIMVNPLCIVAYTIASWRFFHERVFVEEDSLFYFFGDEYFQYQQRVGTGLPFIHGYKVNC